MSNAVWIQFVFFIPVLSDVWLITSFIYLYFDQVQANELSFIL